MMFGLAMDVYSIKDYEPTLSIISINVLLLAGLLMTLYDWLFNVLHIYSIMQMFSAHIQNKSPKVSF